MIVFDFLFVIVLAVILSWVFVGGFRWRHTPDGSGWASGVLLFVFIGLMMWAAFLWLPPAGPVVGDVAWVPLLVVGILVALIFAVASPPRRRRPTAITPPEQPSADPSGMFGVFFWVAVLILAIVIIAPIVYAA